MPISTRVAEMGEGGGFVEDADVLITKARYVLSNERPDYQKSIKDGKIQLLLALSCVPFTSEGYGKEQEQLWTGGEASRLVPTADGLLMDLAIGAPPSTRLVKTSNIGQLYQSWETNDPVTDRDQPGIGVSILEGFKVHLLKVAVKGRENLAVNIPGQQAKNPPGVLLVSKIYGKDLAALQAYRAAQAAGGQAPAPVVTPVQQFAPAPMGQAPAPVAVPAPVGSLDSGALQQVLMELVAAGPVAKGKLATAAFSAVNTRWPSQRNDYLRLLTSDDFLKSAPVNYDGTTVSPL